MAKTHNVETLAEKDNSGQGRNEHHLDIGIFTRRVIDKLEGREEDHNL